MILEEVGLFSLAKVRITVILTRNHSILTACPPVSSCALLRGPHSSTLTVCPLLTRQLERILATVSQRPPVRIGFPHPSSLSTHFPTDFSLYSRLLSSGILRNSNMQRNILIVMDGNWFYNSIVLGQNPYDIDSIRRALGRDWEQTHRIDYRRLVNEIEGHTTRFQPSARTFRSVAFFCSPPNVPMPANRLRMLEDMTASGFEIYHVPSNPVAVATELVSSISTYDIACVISGDRSIAYTMGHIKAKGKLVELVTLRGAFNESDYALLDLPVFWLEDRVVSYVTPLSVLAMTSTALSSVSGEGASTSG